MAMPPPPGPDPQDLLNRAALFALLAGGFVYPNPRQRAAMGERFQRIRQTQTELEFYSLLLVKQAYALEEGWTDRFEISAQAARDFMVQHLGRWTRAFTRELTRQDASAPYQTLATLLHGTLEREWAWLGIAPDPLPEGLAMDLMREDCPTCPRAGNERP